MSLEKIAKILHVDEVKLMHGPKGVAVYVSIGKSMHSCTIDNEDLGETKAERMKSIAEHLLHLADAHVRGSDLRKAAEAASREPERRGGMLSWDDVGGYQPWPEPRQRQVQRAEPTYAPPVVADAPVEPVVSAPMSSRFHAIIEELKGL